MVQLTLNILLKDSILDDKSIIKSYKRVSSFYDYTFGKVFKPGQKKLVSMMECTPTDKVLEIGIGTGTSYSYYPDETVVIGIDISPDMLDKARNHIESNRLKNKSVVMMNGEQHQFEDNSFDTIVTFQVIEHINNDNLFVEEIYRILRPGGKALITTPNIEMTLTRNPWHIREYTSRQLQDLAENFFSKITIII